VIGLGSTPYLGKQRSSTVIVGWGIQRLLLPVKTKDKQILDCVIKKTHTLKHHVNVMLGLVAHFQVLCQVFWHAPMLTMF
jgi:hypothetical protein